MSIAASATTDRTNVLFFKSSDRIEIKKMVRKKHSSRLPAPKGPSANCSFTLEADATRKAG